MQCPIQAKDNAAILLDYCSRRLDPETTAMLERHIAVCPDCRNMAEAQKTVWQALDAWETEPVALDFDRRLYRRIESERSSWRRLLASPFERMSFRPAMSLAAACLAIVAVILIQEPAGVDQGMQARADSVEVENVESTLEDIDMLRQMEALGVKLGAQEAASRTL